MPSLTVLVAQESHNAEHVCYTIGFHQASTAIMCMAVDYYGTMNDVGLESGAVAVRHINQVTIVRDSLSFMF